MPISSVFVCLGYAQVSALCTNEIPKGSCCVQRSEGQGVANMSCFRHSVSGDIWGDQCVQRKEGQGVTKMSSFSHYVPGDLLVMVPVGLDVPLGCSGQVPILHGALKPGTEAGTYVRITVVDLGVRMVSPTGTLPRLR